ncbi:MAG: iron(III) transport system ATP-binding protein, partial [Candidatus Aldehydirespiratoraceae bacterium]
YRSPADPWLAEFVGEAELLVGEAAGERATTALGSIPLRESAHGLVQVLLRPEDIDLAEVDANGASEGVVIEVEYYGHDALSAVRLLDGSVVRSRVTGAPRFGLGETVAVSHRGDPTVAFATSA